MARLLHFISFASAAALAGRRPSAVATRATPPAAIAERALLTTNDGLNTLSPRAGAGALSRRTLLALTCATPLSARAGRVEDMLATDQATMHENPDAVRGPVARTVQTSKLGVAVRRAVVKSAQFDDAMDARWDALSYNLRPKVAPPAPRPPPKPVDRAFAEAARRCGVDACCAAARVSPRAVEEAIAAGRETYASLWETRANAAFGLETYAAFRAFNAFLKDDAAAARFESTLGTALLDGPYAAVRPSRPAHKSQRDLESAIAGCVDLLELSKAANLCGQLEVSPPDAEDLVDLAARAAWGDESKDVANPSPQLQLSAKLVDAAELPPRLMLETQAKRLGLRVLPDATASALRAYLIRCGARPVCEEYFVDDVYRTAFDKDDYSTVQLEVLIN